MNVLLSIVIPTKNRYSYIDYILRYFILIDSKNIELVIQDNSDDSSSLKIKTDLKKYNDSRIRYFRLEGHISQTENCDLAISHACGEYITMIGDDDIFSKYLVDYCALWSKLGYEAILPNKASYVWPDVSPRLHKNSSGVLRTNKYTGNISHIDVSTLPSKIVGLGGSDISNLPRVYHGIVKKSVLDKVYEHCGSYSPGPSPDISNGIALCKYLKNYIYVDLPLITSGQCVSSAGGKGAQGEHYAEIDQVKQLPENCASDWNYKIPFYWSGKTIYAESVSKSLQSMGMVEELNNFNYEYLYAVCLVFDWRYKERIFTSIKSNTSLLKITTIFFYCILIFFRRISFHIRTYAFGFLKEIFFHKDQLSVSAKNTLEVATMLDKKIL